MAQQGFTVEEAPDNVAPFPQPKPPAGQQAAIAGILLGLKALSQGAAIALANVASHLFSLLTVASAFWLWAAHPQPDIYQLVSLGGYAVFVLAANIVIRRK